LMRIRWICRSGSIFGPYLLIVEDYMTTPRMICIYVWCSFISFWFHRDWVTILTPDQIRRSDTKIKIALQAWWFSES
jgi:hypothetical protein